ncbi:hypothetical protein ACP3TI_11910, partial [Desulforudis sp. 1190]|uniref:hypothetical protein n=1 Tax=Desulforudis sp. 1190 TaxID=3416136 RepID=UPI003CF8AA52
CQPRDVPFRNVAREARRFVVRGLTEGKTPVVLRNLFRDPSRGGGHAKEEKTVQGSQYLEAIAGTACGAAKPVNGGGHNETVFEGIEY